jgi:hypothetical protein
MNLLDYSDVNAVQTESGEENQQQQSYDAVNSGPVGIK